MEHRSGRAAALDGVEHRSRGLRSGAERSIGAEGCAAEHRSGSSEHRSGRAAALWSGADSREDRSIGVQDFSS